MIRTEIPTTYGQLVTGDIIWIDSEGWEITAKGGVGIIICLTARDPQGTLHTLTQEMNHPVYRAARTN